MIRIATFNMLGFSSDCPNDTDERKKRSMEMIEQEHIDIALLQEIKTRYQKETGEMEHFTEGWIRRSSSYNANTRIIYGDQRTDSQEAVGVLSQHEIVWENYGPLPKGLFGRSYVVTKIKVADEIYVYAMTFHLAAPAIGRMVTQYGATDESQERAREQQLDRVKVIVEDLDSRYPVFVGADFNIDTDRPLYRTWRENLRMTEIYADTPEARRKTFATHRSPSFDCALERRLDHLVYRDGDEIKVRVLDEGLVFSEPVDDESRFFYGYLSDHAGVFADVELKRI